MARTRIEFNVETGEQSIIPYTQEEEIAADLILSEQVPPSYRLYKSVFISRLNEGTNEPEVMEATLAAAPAKLRLLFNSVEYFVSDDPLFYDLYEAIASVLGPYRATQLLEPSREP